MAFFDKFKRKIERALDKKISPVVVSRATAAFEKAKKKHIEDIINDDVCKELRAGTKRSSKFLSVDDGDLFSFFGFPAGSDPVGALEVFLENNITIKFPSKRVKNLKISSLISYPSRSDFEIPLFELKWESKSAGSWVNRMEDGIPGLSQYIPLNDFGRSGGGLQNKKIRKSIQSADFGGVPFITIFHKPNFFKNVSKIKI